MARQRNGRFAKGNTGGPGRPRLTVTEREYMEATMEACPVSAWREIVAAAVNDAKAGNARARDWLARYLVGLPSQPAYIGSDIKAEDEQDEDDYHGLAGLKRLAKQ